MRLRLALATALLLASLPAAHADGDPAPDVRITELLPAPDASLGQREFIELHNAGPAAIDLAGWTLRDAPTASNSTNAYTFGPFHLAAGQRIVVWSNGSADARGPAWSTSPSKSVWNDAGDAATLLGPDGTVRDWLGYGSTTQPAPAGHAMAKPPAPGKGKSIALHDDAWSAAEPTPALAPGQQGGGVQARVSDVAPTVRLIAPATTKAGAPLTLQLEANDGNGPDDVATWTLSAGGAVLRAGNGSFAGDVTVTAPAKPGAWTLVAAVTDHAGNAGNATALVSVQAPSLAVTLPPGGALRFPDLRPGDRDVTSLDALTLRNDGTLPTRPLLDMSPLHAGAATIGVEGNLWLGVTLDGATTWLRYDAPLEELPELEVGASATLALRIAQVPAPAAAGLYGTTFTVVAT